MFLIVSFSSNVRTVGMLGCNKLVSFVLVKHNLLVILDEGFMSLLYSAFIYAITC